jgi:TetR/AcrR family transcriptional regulator, mexJK operon transcriptional repressor
LSDAIPSPGCRPCVSDGLSDRASARRQAFVAAGRELFLERGYAATTCADVVARSGGSLATLYALFGTKRGLFEAILRDHAESVMRPLCVEGVSNDPEIGLMAVGQRYLAGLLEPDVVAWWRALVAEAPHTPELREVFLSEEGGPIQQALAFYLAEQAKDGRLAIADAGRAAGQFLALVRGSLHHRALAGDASVSSSEEIDRHVRSAVHVFIHGYRPRAAAG